MNANEPGDLVLLSANEPVNGGAVLSYAPRSAVIAALAALGLPARAAGDGVYVEHQGLLTVTEAATLAAELAQMEEVDRDLATDVVTVLAGALELIDALASDLRQAHAELRRGIRELSVHGHVAPRSLELAITRSLPTLKRASEFAPGSVGQLADEARQEREICIEPVEEVRHG